MDKQLNIIGIGEILWDMLPQGKQLGGAPGNFAFHVTKLGENGMVVSAVGDDSDGMEIISRLKDKGLPVDYVQVNGHNTSRVDIRLDKEGVPCYIINENVAWDYIENSAGLADVFKQADAVCFGSLAQRNSVTKETIFKCLGNCPDSCLKVYDINLRQNYYSKEIIEKSLEVSDVLKLNDEELPVVCSLLGIEGDEIPAIRELIERFHLKLVAYTLGSKGSYLVTDHEQSFMPTPEVEVVDTVGAGDSFTASMVVSYMRGESLTEVHAKAVRLSAYVCTQKGAMPDYKCN